jgi:HK97 family phage major capsid protein
MSTEIKEVLEGLGAQWKEYRETNDARLDALEDGKGVAEFEEKLEKLGGAMDTLTEQRDEALTKANIIQERLEEVEATIDGFGTIKSSKVRKEVKEYEETFDSWMRSFAQFGGKQADPEVSSRLHSLQKQLIESKDIDTTAGASGGFAVPEIISTQIHDQLRLLSPMRDLCRVVSVGTSDYKELVNIHGEASAWVGETGTRSTSTTPSFRERAPTMGTLYAYPRSTEEALDDVFFNVQQLLVDVTSTEFAIAESTAFLAGDGTNKPTGIFDTAPATTDDDASPPRSAEAIEYVPLDTASPTTAVEADQLLTLLYLLRSGYRQNATWAMNSNFTATVRKLKDGQNQYLWAPGLQAGQPDMLLGYPVRTLEAMDSGTAVGEHPILFGDFSRGYLIVDRVGLRITVDNNITVPGYVQWYIRKRVGGILLDNNAIKAGKWASS